MKSLFVTAARLYSCARENRDVGCSHPIHKRYALGGGKRKPVDPETVRVSFEDVAGIDEVEAEINEVFEFLRDSGKYRRLGARAPKGVLLAARPCARDGPCFAPLVRAYERWPYASVVEPRNLEPCVSGLARLRPREARAEFGLYSQIVLPCPAWGVIGNLHVRTMCAEHGRVLIPG